MLITMSSSSFGSVFMYSSVCKSFTYTPGKYLLWQICISNVSSTKEEANHYIYIIIIAYTLWSHIKQNSHALVMDPIGREFMLGATYYAWWTALCAMETSTPLFHFCSYFVQDRINNFNRHMLDPVIHFTAYTLSLCHLVYRRIQ